jgi:hypothetical protein
VHPPCFALSPATIPSCCAPSLATPHPSHPYHPWRMDLITLTCAYLGQLCLGQLCLPWVSCTWASCTSCTYPGSVAPTLGQLHLGQLRLPWVSCAWASCAYPGSVAPGSVAPVAVASCASSSCAGAYSLPWVVYHHPLHHTNNPVAHTSPPIQSPNHLTCGQLRLVAPSCASCACNWYQPSG